MLLPGCTPAPILPAPVITYSACQTVSPCRLPAMAPRTNGELSEALTTTQAAWASCAAVVDAIVQCQTELEGGASAAATP
ncbi:Rz1-like lysis system protein LysC [Burkholderia gladioli]|uniref:Rz1-like lysis system protein LysC n=1 Tax=Burkholderia gladioli TaxID=28095 RepID=UPI001FC7ED01|nr:Rz1-like lysis system protein LysC [Burkholderia gladioli]